MRLLLLEHGAKESTADQKRWELREACDMNERAWLMNFHRDDREGFVSRAASGKYTKSDVHDSVMCRCRPKHVAVAVRLLATFLKPLRGVAEPWPVALESPGRARNAR